MRIHWQNPIRDSLAIAFGAVFAHSFFYGPSAFDQVLLHAINVKNLIIAQAIGALIGLIVGTVMFEHIFTNKREEPNRAVRLDGSLRALIACPLIGLGIMPIVFALFAYLFLALEFLTEHAPSVKTAIGALVAAAVIVLIGVSIVLPISRAIRSRMTR